MERALFCLNPRGVKKLTSLILLGLITVMIQGNTMASEDGNLESAIMDLWCSGNPPGAIHLYVCFCEASTWYGRRDNFYQSYYPNGVEQAWILHQYEHWWDQESDEFRGFGDGVEDIEAPGLPELQFPEHHYECQWQPLQPE